MPTTRIDVHVRRPDELAGLTRIYEALQGLGAEAVLTADPRGFPSPPLGAELGPVPSEIRVVQAGSAAEPLGEPERPQPHAVVKTCSCLSVLPWPFWLCLERPSILK